MLKDTTSPERMKDIVLAFGVGEHDERLASLLDSMIERGTHPDAWVSAWMGAGARQELSDKPTLRVAVLFAEAVLRHMSMLMKDTVVDGKSVWAHMRLPDNYFPLLFRATGTRTELSWCTSACPGSSKTCRSSSGM